MSQETKRTLKRGALSKKNAELIGGWFDVSLVQAIDSEVTKRDLDRSKWLREAAREKLLRDGYPAPVAA